MNELGPEARAILEAGRHLDNPSAAQLRRTGRLLALRLGAGAAVVASSTTTWAVPIGKVVLTAALMATGGVGAGLWWRATRAAPSPTIAIEAAPVRAPDVENVMPIETAPALPKGVRTAAPRVSRAAAPVATGRSAPVSPTPSAPVAASRLEEETALLSEVNRKVAGGESREALRLLDTYDHRFPSGVLAEESAATRVIVLCQMERAGKTVSPARALSRRSTRDRRSCRASSGLVRVTRIEVSASSVSSYLSAGF